MPKKLPYFKFDTTAWRTGKINYMSIESKGVFITLCCLIWENGGEYELNSFTHRFCFCDEPLFNQCVQELTTAELLLNHGSILSVKFISEQLEEYAIFCEKQAVKGRKSALARTSVKQRSTINSNSNSNSNSKKKNKEDSPKTPKGAKLHDEVVKAIKWPDSCDQEIKKLFLMFLDERRTKKKYVTENAIVGLFGKLKKFTKDEQTTAINDAIAGGYQSFFPKKAQQQSSGPVQNTTRLPTTAELAAQEGVASNEDELQF